LQKDKAEETLLDDLCRALDSPYEGCLSVLRHGFKCFGKLFRVAYFAPASGLNPDTQKLYDANRLTITRQLRYSNQHGNTLDVVLSLNGIPIATVELKNPMTGQTWRNAVSQYKNDRDPNEEITAKFLNDKEFQQVVGQHLLKEVYEHIRYEETGMR